MNDKLKESGISDTSRSSKARRFTEAGYVAPSCLFCHEPDLCVLQLHHVAGQANSELLVPLCGNCHLIVSDDQSDLPANVLSGDLHRRPLVLQAAFNFGLAIVTGIISTDSPDGTEAVFWALVTVGLIAWGVWDIAADGYFLVAFGLDYSEGILAPVPR
jgi:hypothetical protein